MRQGRSRSDTVPLVCYVEPHDSTPGLTSFRLAVLQANAIAPPPPPTYSAKTEAEDDSDVEIVETTKVTDHVFVIDHRLKLTGL